MIEFTLQDGDLRGGLPDSEGWTLRSLNRAVVTEFPGRVSMGAGHVAVGEVPVAVLVMPDGWTPGAAEILGSYDYELWDGTDVTLRGTVVVRYREPELEVVAGPSVDGLAAGPLSDVDGVRGTYHLDGVNVSAGSVSTAVLGDTDLVGRDVVTVRDAVSVERGRDRIVERSFTVPNRAPSGVGGRIRLRVFAAP